MTGALKNTEMDLKAKKVLSGLNFRLETEPALFVDQGGNYWSNTHADSFLSRQKVSAAELIEWVSAAGGCLRELCYQGIRMELSGIPGEGMLVFLKAASKSAPGTALTERERQVLVMLVKGLSNKEIAKGLKVSPGTVNSHLDNIYRKLGVSGRLHACLLALTNGVPFLSKKQGAVRLVPGK